MNLVYYLVILLIGFLKFFYVYLMNLLMSGGSDYHGDKHKDLELGTGFGSLVVNEEAIKEWI